MERKKFTSCSFSQDSLAKTDLRGVIFVQGSYYRATALLLAFTLLAAAAFLTGAISSQLSRIILSKPSDETPLLTIILLATSLLFSSFTWSISFIQGGTANAVKRTFLSLSFLIFIDSFILSLTLGKEEVANFLLPCLIFSCVFLGVSFSSLLLRTVSILIFNVLLPTNSLLKHRLSTVTFVFLVGLTTYFFQLQPATDVYDSILSDPMFAWAGAAIGGIAGCLLNQGSFSILSLSHKPELHFLQDWARALGAWGGCSFHGLNLSEVDFSGSYLSHSDFRACLWYRTILRGAKGLHSSQIDNKYLDLHLPQVQKLLTDCDPGDKNFQGVVLRGAYLRGLDLRNVNFTDTDLRGADLRNANLSDSLLIDTRLDGADLTGAMLRGACLRKSVLESAIAQNIILVGVQCDHLYLGFERGEPCDRQDFAKGELERLYYSPVTLQPASSSVSDHVRRILFLATNPRGTTNLALPQEFRDIQDAWAKSRNEGQFRIEPRFAARRDDLRTALLNFKPHIIHFAGHGDGEEGLVFENEAGRSEWFPTQALSNLFKEFSTQIECVILNACYSEIQAEAISQHIDYVIGMKQAIPDAAARAFSRGFYDALFANYPIETSFRIGLRSIESESLDSSSPDRKVIAIPTSDLTNQPILLSNLIPQLTPRPGVHIDPVEYVGTVWTRIVPESRNINKLHYIAIRWGDKKWENQRVIPEQGILLYYQKREQQPYHRSVRLSTPDPDAYSNAISSVSRDTRISSGHLNPPETPLQEDITLS